MKPEIKQRIEQLNNGKIPKGYKKTDFGVFPCDWVTDETLGDLFDFYGGLSKSRDELGEEGYAYLHYGDLHRGTFNLVSIDQYEQLPKCDISLTGKEKCLMEDGDVAFLDASEDLEGTSRAVLIDNPENKPFIAGLHIIYGKAKANSLDKWFKQYITSSESVKKQFQRLSVGFKVYGVNRDTIPRIKVAFPSSNKEQSRIAEILMKWDEAIELYDKQIDALTRYKAVCLRKMIPAKGQNVPEWRFQGFTGAWEQRKLGKLAIFNPKAELPEIFEYVDLESVVGTEMISHRTESKITAPSRAQRLARTGDLFYQTVRPYQKNNYLFEKPDKHYVFSTGYAQMRPLVDGQFLLSLVQNENFVKMVLDNCTGTSYPAINSNDLADIEVLSPTEKEEQRIIGSFFKGIGNLITLHQRKKETIINQRKTLQQYLLNGIVRVKS